MMSSLLLAATLSATPVAPVPETPAPAQPVIAQPVVPTAPPPEAPALPETPPPLTNTPAPQADGTTDIVVTGDGRAPAGDPLDEVNAASYAVTQSVDKGLVAPIAFAYKKALPSPGRKGVRNVIANLAEPITFLNDLLQLRPRRAIRTLGRFGVNTTFGVAGLVDVAKTRPFNLPPRRNGFANTLGVYGVKPGPYLFLPLVGPTTVRDLIGLGVDRAVMPMAFGKPFNRPVFTTTSGVLTSLDYRIEFDDDLRRIRAESDPYTAARVHYLKLRQAEIDALKAKDGK